MRKTFKPFWKCSKDCELCEGDGKVFTGMEGFINRDMEQDVRDTFDACPNATWDEPDWDAMIDEQRDRKAMGDD
jgi:hypothetical protein